VAPLTEGERGELQACEGIIERGLGTCFEVGDALLRIRESRLYRDTHTTFKQYCQEKWNLGRSYAWRVMGAAERLKLLTNDGDLPRPANECQMRPFLKLTPEEFPAAWKKAVKSATQGKVTPTIVQAVINYLLAKKQDRPRSRKNATKKTVSLRIPAGQVLMLLTEAKRQIKSGDTDKAVAALERIESLLFSM
jgi:hypothetical protein